MRRINNPFLEVSGYNCFGCHPENSFGLKMDFFEDSDEIVSVWQPKDYFCGYNDILHGGIQATMCDELASWVVYVKCKCSGVTSRLNMKYRNPVQISKGNVTLKGKIKENKKNKFAVIEISLFDGGGLLCAEAEAVFRLFSHDDSVNLYGYPKDDVF